MDGNFCYKDFVIADYEKKEITVGMKIGASIKRMLDEIVDEQDRSISYIARELLIRGLALYEIDGKLKGEPLQSERRVNETSTTKSAAIKTKFDLAPVVGEITSPAAEAAILYFLT